MDDLKSDVLAFLRQEKPQLLTLGVQAVGCFGSVVRGEARSDSDIDILIDVKPD